MSGQVATGAPDAQLKRIISEKRQRLRKNVHILFLGLSAEEADPIITLLRGARLAPRGKQVHSVAEFTEALSEQAWDLILSPQVEGTFTAKEAIHILQRQNRDIPVIQLVPRNTSQALLQGLKARMATVISLEEKELLLIQIRRQLDHLENRRRLKLVEAQLAAAEQHSQQLADLSALPIIYLDHTCTPVYLNQAFADQFGMDSVKSLHGDSLDKFVGLKSREKLLQAISEAQQPDTPNVELELECRRIDGTNFNAQFTMQPISFMQQDCVQVLIRPDSMNDSFQHKDPITGLYNRDYFVNSLSSAVSKALPGGADCSLLFIKFDNFSTMQGELGSNGYDIMLSDMAELINKKINRAHILARIDENIFAILFHDPSTEKAIKLGEQLCKLVAMQKVDVTGITIQTTCSIGICAINDNAPHYMEVLDRARHAADNVGSRSRRGNGVKLYELQLEEEPVDDEALQLIQDALADDKFHLLFQPIVGLTSANGLGNYEVFLRLEAPEGDTEVSPNVFLTTLDHAETCIEMDKWVIEKTFNAVSAQLKEQKRTRVFINLTARFYQSNDVLQWISEQLKQYRIPADLITFQISESDLTTTLAQADRFADGLKKLGCKLCIKHFGASAKSNELRNQLKPDLIKLDGSYIQDLEVSPEADKMFAKKIKALKAANIVTIAPLVEDTRLMGKLWKLGIDFIQGHYLQPPQPEMDYDFFE